MEHEKMAIFAPKLCQICVFLVTTKKLGSDLESPHFPVFRKTLRMQNWKGRCTWSWKIKKWLWKSHGKILCQVWYP